MNEKLVILVGGTGHLGGRVLRALKAENATVRCLVRSSTAKEKRSWLKQYATEITEVDFTDVSAIAKACEGGHVVLSTLSGLRDVIVDLQKSILTAAIHAGVPRFIPSDFAIDYRPIPQGENRNLNLREEFRQILDTSSIKATSILNGAFMDMLTGVAPYILFPIRRVLCWGNPDQLMDFTLIDDVAKYTAKATLDPTTPRYLKIAGNVVSSNDLAGIMTELTGKKHKVLRPGGLDAFKRVIKLTKLLTPDRGQIFPAWQGMQYMHSSLKGDSKFKELDNNRYKMKWTTVRELLDDFLHNKDFVKYKVSD